MANIDMNLLLVAVVLFTGLLMTRVTNVFKLPDVTAYLIIGVIIGPSVLGKLGINGLGFASFEEVSKLSILSDVALGFIAFEIGNEFKVDDLKKVGKQVFTIGIFQAVITTIVVDVVLITLHFMMPNVVTLPMALCLGAIAAATAPAATIMVIRQYKAKGPVTKVLLPVVALDDAVGLMIFASSFGVATALINGEVQVLNVIMEPILEIIMSLSIGIISAIVLTNLEKFFKSNANRLILIIATVVLSVAIAKSTYSLGGFNSKFSSLLVCMALGIIFCNICPLSDDLMKNSSNWSQPIIVLFFVLSGAELDFDVFKNPIVIIIGIIYVFARAFGKYFGARISASLSGTSKTIRKYLGITLLPQAGVALGMSAIVSNALGKDGVLIRNITLFGVLVYELFGPSLTKIALTKAGEIKEIPKSVKNRRTKMLKAAKLKRILGKIFSE